jgi:hypothetical protein
MLAIWNDATKHIYYENLEKELENSGTMMNLADTLSLNNCESKLSSLVGVLHNSMRSSMNKISKDSVVAFFESM